MTAKRIFVAFAIEDKQMRDLLKGQSLHTNLPFEYTDMSVKEPWDSKWKTNCRTRIKGCDGVIALLSRNSLVADGQKWEINCAKEEGIPLIGMYISNNDTSSPKEMDGIRKIKWVQENIKGFIDEL